MKSKLILYFSRYQERLKWFLNFELKFFSDSIGKPITLQANWNFSEVFEAVDILKQYFSVV